MRPYTRAATRYLWATVAAGLMLVAFSLWRGRNVSPDWTCFVPLTLLAAFAHLYPIRSASESAFYVVADIFLLASVILLDPASLAIMCVLVMLPYTISMRKRGPRIWIRYAFNSSSTVVSTFAAQTLIQLSGGPDLASLSGTAIIMAAATLFTLIQTLQTTVILALNGNTSIFKVGTLAPKSLLAEGIQPFLGIVLAGLWHHTPWVLGVLPIPIMITYMLVRQVHLLPNEELDSKTGLYSYKYFQKMVTEELARSIRVRRPLSVIFADMDYLRNVNNQWGHLAGDEVLKQIAEIIRRNLRHGDVAARFGGEEFVLMLTGTDLDEAQYVAERIRSAVAEWPFAIGGGRTINCTISLGVSCASRHGTELTELLEAADAALYRAKAQGRNQVACAADKAGMEAACPVAEVAAALQEAAPVAIQPAAAAVPRPQVLQVLARCLLASVVVGGLASIVLGVLSLETVSPIAVLILAGMAIVAELLKTRVYESGEQKITVTLSTAVAMAALSAAGFSIAVACMLISAITHLCTTRPKSFEKLLFNLFNPVLSIAVSAMAYEWIAESSRTLDVQRFLAGVVAAMLFNQINVGLISCMVSLRNDMRLVQVWRSNSWLAVPMTFLGLIGICVVLAYHSVGWVGVLLFTGPVLILRYSFSLYAQRTQSSIAALERAKAEVERAHAEKHQALDELIITMAAIIDARDNSTYGHSKQVARYAVALGEMLGLDQAARDEIRTAALLHDLGKVGVPEAILKKPDRLTDEEYATIKEHAPLGERILSEISALGQVARMVGEHHERFDGTGYPRAKAGTEISIGGRILAVADALDSILSDRPYSRGRSLEEALEELRRCSGHHFDPLVVDAVMRYVQEYGPGQFVNSARSVDPDHPLDGVAD